MPLKDSSLSPTIEPLRRVTDLWLDPNSALRKRAIEALSVSTGYPARLVQKALDDAFGEITQEKISEFIRSKKMGFRSPSQSVVLHIGAGNVFTAWLHGAVISLLLGYRCWIKPSTQEPAFANLWRQSVQMIDFSLADRIAIVSWSEALLAQAAAVVAYGSDETLAELRSKTPEGTRFIGFGHKVSIAVAFEESAQPGPWPLWQERAVADCELFELNGCLSPQVIYVENGPGQWKSLGESLRPCPEIRTFARFEEILKDLQPLQGRLSALGVAGPLSRVEEFRPALEALGMTRICELGQMQRPPLSWRNGGLSLAEILSRPS